MSTTFNAIIYQSGCPVGELTQIQTIRSPFASSENKPVLKGKWRLTYQWRGRWNSIDHAYTQEALNLSTYNGYHEWSMHSHGGGLFITRQLPVNNEIFEFPFLFRSQNISLTGIPELLLYKDRIVARILSTDDSHRHVGIYSYETTSEGLGFLTNSLENKTELIVDGIGPKRQLVYLDDNILKLSYVEDDLDKIRSAHKSLILSSVEESFLERLHLWENRWPSKRPDYC